MVLHFLALLLGTETKTYISAMSLVGDISKSPAACVPVLTADYLSPSSDSILFICRAQKLQPIVFVEKIHIGTSLAEEKREAAFRLREKHHFLILNKRR